MSEEESGLLNLWHNAEDFQTAVGHLLSIPAKAITELPTDVDFDAPVGPPPEDVPDNIWASAATAYRTLYVFARDSSPKSVVSELKQLSAHDDTDPVWDNLSSALTPRPEADRSLVFRNIENGVLPILDLASLFLDLRTVPRSTNSDADGPQLIPVVIARLDFDEPVGSSQSIVFQVPWAALKNLSKQVEEIQHQLDDLRILLPEEATKPWAWRAGTNDDLG